MGNCPPGELSGYSNIYIYIAHNNQEDSLCASQELSYLLKDNVFKDFRKLLVSVSAVSLSHNLFHKIGIADANARSPYVKVDEGGTTRYKRIRISIGVNNVGASTSNSYLFILDLALVSV